MSKQIIAIIRNAAPYDFGGGERFPVFLAESLARNNLQPIIISRSKKLLEFADSNTVETVKGWWWSKQNWSGLNILLTPIYIVWQVVLFFYYLSLFIKLSPSAIHIQSKDDFIAATYAGKLLKKRVIWTDHADLKHIWQNLSVWYKNPISKMVYRAALYADAITVVSNSELQLVTQHLPKESLVREKIMTVYNGVFDQSSLFLSESKPKQNFTFLVASRLVKDKGIGEVIDAFKQLVTEYKDISLQIIGDGPDREIFKQQASDTSQIHMLGHQSQPLTFMAAADVFVHPTYHEGFSVALVEAGMMSLPIITTSVGGNVEIIENEKTGLLVSKENTAELYSAMKRLYENNELRKELGKNARIQYLEKFQFNQIVNKSFMPLYEVTL